MTKILVIDDELEICKQISIILSKQGYEVTYANSYKEFADLEQRNFDYDVVLVDLWLKNSTKQGIDIIEYLKNKYENHVNDFGSKKTIRYEASLVPKKCNAKTDFLYVGNDLIGYGYTGHQSWAFDETLLDSNISLCYEEKNLKYAQIYLDKQISRAKKNKKIKLFFVIF